jgi:hypothetical protein
MRLSTRRLATLGAAAFMSMAALVVAPPGVSSAECDRRMSWNPVTNECKPPPAPPAWYTPPPAYAPSFAPPDIPPPPPTPAWAPQAPMWSNGYQHWGVYVGGVWVPI